MPAVVDYPRPPIPFVFHTSESEEWTLQPQGSEAIQLCAKAGEAYRHWVDRADVLISEPSEVDDFSYAPGPPNRTYLVLTRYVYGGKGEPLPFVWDE